MSSAQGILQRPASPRIPQSPSIQGLHVPKDLTGELRPLHTQQDISEPDLRGRICGWITK